MDDQCVVDTVISEFKRKLWESRNLLANPTLEKCRVHVELDRANRVPISKNTKFVPFPKILGDGHDAKLMMFRYNEGVGYLLENWEFIVSGYESGSNSYRMNIHNFLTITDETRPSVCLFYKNAKGKWVSSGLQ